MPIQVGYFPTLAIKSQLGRDGRRTSRENRQLQLRHVPVLRRHCSLRKRNPGSIQFPRGPRNHGDEIRSSVIQEMRVNSGLYDASQGGKSGAQIETTTRAGTNQFHGMAYDHFENNDLNANEFFRNAVPNTAASGLAANNGLTANAPDRKSTRLN